VKTLASTEPGIAPVSVVGLPLGSIRNLVLRCVAGVSVPSALSLISVSMQARRRSAGDVRGTAVGLRPATYGGLDRVPGARCGHVVYDAVAPGALKTPILIRKGQVADRISIVIPCSTTPVAYE
jgi:hypothetical protein